MTETPLDLAHARMETAPDDDRARLGFFERLGDGELFLLLARESEGDTAEPRLFELRKQCHRDATGHHREDRDHDHDLDQRKALLAPPAGQSSLHGRVSRVGHGASRSLH